MTSIRLTVFLLLILAVLAVAGTVAFPEIYYRFWFLAPLSLLTLNLLACMVEGLPRAIRKAARPFTGEMALSLPERGRFLWPSEAEAPLLAQEALRRELGRPRREMIDGKEVFFYGRGRLRPLGPYVVHLALVLILAGGVVGKFWGIEGRVVLQPDLPISAMELDQEKTLPLAFEVRLDRFQVFYYRQGSGMPKEFRSDLSFLQAGKAPVKAVCRVNEPVIFGGYTFYQSSYGVLPPKSIPLEVFQGGQRRMLELTPRRWTSLPDDQGQIMAVRVEGNLQGFGPAVELAHRLGSGHPRLFWLLAKHPPGGQSLGALRLALGPLDFKYYSVLQVKHDPGVAWVYGGFLLLLPGLYLAFLRPQQRWAVVLAQGKGGRWEGRLLGASPRGRENFAVHTERLLARLQKGAS